jgi:hypothetical protein
MNFLRGVAADSHCQGTSRGRYKKAKNGCDHNPAQITRPIAAENYVRDRQKQIKNNIL